MPSAAFRHRFAILALTVFAVPALGQASAPAADTATFDADGTAHITRVVPIPPTVSPEAQQWLKEIEKESPPSNDLSEQRKHTDEWRKRDSAEALKRFPVKVNPRTIAGVSIDLIEPLAIPASNEDKVLINLHGGGFITDSGSLIEGIPIANLTKIRVVSVYYRLAPENPFPAAIDDVVAVYKELLKTHRPENIGIYGTSAGAILTGEVAVKLKQLNLPLPAALGIFSGLADFSRPADSQQIYGLNGLSAYIQPTDVHHPHDASYIGAADPKDPVLSPLFADLHGLPSTLLVTSTRDLLLSNTAIFHLALLRAGVDARLVVFEALPHAFWYHFQLPETQQALELMAHFFEETVGRR